MKRIALALISTAVLLSLTLAVACSATNIGDILKNFPQDQGKEVTVKGTVGETVWLAPLQRGAYQVSDTSGKIWVVTSQPPPQQGVEVSVTGTVQAAFTLGDRSLGTVIVETRRG